MTPSCPHPASGIHRHHLAIRRSMAGFVAALAIVAAPLVARALEDDPVPAAAVPQPLRSEAAAQRRNVAPPLSIPTVADRAAEIAPSPAPSPEPSAVPVPETPLEGITRVMTATYTWDERSPHVEQLAVRARDPRRRLVCRQDAGGASRGAGVRRPAGRHSAHQADSRRSGSRAVGCPTASVESGGDYTITNPSGKYRGAYQFDRSTWNSVAGRYDPSLVGVDPAAASPADQDAMALALYGERGAQAVAALRSPPALRRHDTSSTPATPARTSHEPMAVTGDDSSNWSATTRIRGEPAVGGDLAHRVAALGVEPLQLGIGGQRTGDETLDRLVVVEERRRDARRHELGADHRQAQVERIGAELRDGSRVEVAGQHDQVVGGGAHRARAPSGVRPRSRPRCRPPPRVVWHRRRRCRRT